MKYSLDNAVSKAKARFYFDKLCDSGAFIELKKISPTRSSNQNRYLHLLFNYLALEYGETTDYVKQYFFKQVCNPAIFAVTYQNEKQGYKRKTWRSTADLDSKEMTEAIERFRNWAAKEAGIYLPAPNEQEFLKSIEEQISQYQNWL